MKERLDTLLVSRGFFPSREKAKASIMAGVVFVDGQISDKAGTKIDTEAEITVKTDPCPYVSRGGLKLERAMKAFPINLQGAVCMDMGASTGGFTDCMLINGASKVYAVDVGYGQLAWKLRTDERVVNIEKCNIRYMDTEETEGRIDFVSIDVSFISLKLILPVAAKVLKPGAHLVCLVKPQFEAGREEMKNTGGIVRDPRVHEDAIRSVKGYAVENGLVAEGLDYSPVKGTKGNIEYLLYLGKETVDSPIVETVTDEGIKEVVELSHNQL